MNKELLIKLYKINSPSKRENKMRSFIIRYVKTMKDVRIQSDKIGNIYLTKGESESYPALVAHMDEVHNIRGEREIIELKGILFGYSMKDMKQVGIGADDKNGIWIALEALRTLPALKVLFTVQEEIGAVGASYASVKFFDDCRFVLECDRKGNSDIITSIYHEKICSDEFLYDIKPIFKSYGYSKNNGLLTDVAELRDNNLNLSCVNISCGYYNPHTDEEYTVLKDLQNCLEMVLEICRSVTNTYLHENHKFHNYYNDSFGGFMCDVCSSMDCGNCPYYSKEGIKYDLYEKK